MDKNNFIEEFTRIFGTPPDELYIIALAIGIVSLLFMVYALCMILFEAFTIYMGTRMVRDEIDYGRCMVLSCATMLISTTIFAITIYFFDPSVSWLVGLAIGMPILLLAILLNELEKMTFVDALLSSILANIFKVGLHVVLTISIAWGLSAFDIESSVADKLEHKREIAREKMEKLKFSEVEAKRWKID